MNKRLQQQKRKTRVRGKVTRHLSRPRLLVTRSNQYIYAQIVGLDGKIIVSSSDGELETKKKLTKTERASLVGKSIAEKAKKNKVTQVAFDRGHYKYHGRVKALAEAARSAGLEL